MTKDADQWFWNILARASQLERERILSSDEEFDKWLKENPLTEQEQKEADAAVERLRARLLKTADDFMRRTGCDATPSKDSTSPDAGAAPSTITPTAPARQLGPQGEGSTP